mgnify:CR=1 FL=1
MESNQELERINEMLNENIPASAVSKRIGGGGMMLSYLEGHYVEDRLNLVYGFNGWELSIVSMQTRDLGQNSRGNSLVVTTVQASLSVYDPKSGEFRVKQNVGHGQGNAKNPGEAYESAEKEAVTDALKRCAKMLGPSMGLALYDKTQSKVDKAPKKAAPKQPAANTGESKDRETLQRLVRQLSAKGIMTTDKVKDLIKVSYGKSKSADLSYDQVKDLNKKLEGML